MQDQFWRHANQPKALFSQQFTQQKLAYIPNNPVAAGMVESAGEIFTVAPGTNLKDAKYGCFV